MKQEVIRTQETNPSRYREHSLGRVASSALRLLPFQRRKQLFEQKFGTDAARRAAHHNLEAACSEQFAAAKDTGNLISVATPEGEGRTHDRLVFESDTQGGERRLMIVDRHTNEGAAPLLRQYYNVSFYQPKDSAGMRRGIQIGVSDVLADMGDVRYTEVAIEKDQTFEQLAANPSATLGAGGGSIEKGEMQLLSPDLANGMAAAIRETGPVNPDFLREAVVVEPRLPELPAA